MLKKIIDVFYNIFKFFIKNKFYIEFELDKDFLKCFKKLKKKYPKLIKMEGLSDDKLDPTRFFKAFLKSDNVANASIDDNSNVNSQAMPTLLKENYKPIMKLLSFNKVFIEMKELFGLKVAQEYLEKKINGTLYEHDNFASSFEPYCFAYSVKTIYEKGLYFINEMKADRPKHLDTFHSHVIESTAFFTNLQSGAVGLVDVLLYSMKFWLDDVKSGYINESNKDKIRDQEFQKLIYALNQPFLKGQQQSAYTNFSIMDRDYFTGLFGELQFLDGTYAIDYLEDFINYQKAFLNFIKEERKKKSFTFPVLTASLIFKDDQFQDEDMAKFCVSHNMKWGDMNIYVSDNPDKLSSCCRAQFSTSDIKKSQKLEGNFNSIGGTDLNIGSSKVCTLNLPRIAYLSNYDFNKTKSLIKENVKLIQKFHKAHRNILKKNIKRGLLPTYEFGLMNLDKQFATVGVTGMEEYIDLLGGLDRNKIEEKEYNEQGLLYAKETLNYINELGEITPEEYGYTQNVEQIPGESANVKILKKDNIVFKDFPIKKVSYSNQWCGLDSKFSLSERIRISGELDKLTGGGQIFHANLGEKWNSFEDAWEFNLTLAKSGVKYWSEIRKYQYCESDHNFFGETCPYCGGKAKGNIIKIVGYLTKDEFYTFERKEELDNRVFYNV